MRPRCGLALPRRHAGRLAWLVAAAASRQDSYMSLLAARVEELRRDREHGASWMARRTGETLLEVAEEPCETCEALVDQLVEAGRKLAESRPGVGAIAGAAGRLLATANAHRYLDLEELRRLIAEEANALVDRRRRAAASIAIQLRGSLEDAVVATHSASATVREELRREGLVVDLLEDVDAPAALKDAALFLVGADTVFRDGTLCNKIGTTALAEAAAARGLPTIVASETVKLAPIEAADAPEPSPAERSLFELTPPELISEIVTEEGSVTSDGVGSLVDRTPFLREGYALLLPAVAL